MARDVQVTHDEFLTFVKRMKEVFPQNYFVPTIASANEWYKALREYSLGQLNTAFDSYIKLNENPPSVAELRNIVRSLTKDTQFNSAEYWGEHNYWVLTDLEGYHLGECIADKEITADEARAFFDKAFSREGTVLKPRDFATYTPKYRRGKPQTITKEDLENTFLGVDIEVER